MQGMRTAARQRRGEAQAERSGLEEEPQSAQVRRRTGGQRGRPGKAGATRFGHTAQGSAKPHKSVLMPSLSTQKTSPSTETQGILEPTIGSAHYVSIVSDATALTLWAVHGTESLTYHKQNVMPKNLVYTSIRVFIGIPCISQQSSHTSGNCLTSPAPMMIFLNC